MNANWVHFVNWKPANYKSLLCFLLLKNKHADCHVRHWQTAFVKACQNHLSWESIMSLTMKVKNESSLKQHPYCRFGHFNTCRNVDNDFHQICSKFGKDKWEDVPANPECVFNLYLFFDSFR